MLKSIYDNVRSPMIRTIGQEPSNDDLKSGVKLVLLNYYPFLEYCNSKNTYNTNWVELCADAFAEYIVFVFDSHKP
jgi:hypothetical protein